MTGFYNITNKIKETLEAEPFVNNVSYGSFDNIDLNKQTIFPLSHVMVNQCTINPKVLTFNISVMCMDIVDISKEETTDLFVGNDNEQDVLNTQLGVLNKLIQLLRRGTLHTDQYQLQGDPTLEPFYDRFENQLAGWALTMDVLVANDIYIC